MSFLPENYEVPAGGNYMRLDDGDNELLILGSAILGFEYWNLENKPVRLKERPTQMPHDIREDENGKRVIKHFWAFPVWNFKSNAVNVLEITQKTLMGQLQNITRNPKWGDPILSYTLTITRSGKGFDTEYSVVANPKEEIPQVVISAWDKAKANGFDLTRLYTGGDPFALSN